MPSSQQQSLINNMLKYQTALKHTQAINLQTIKSLAENDAKVITLTYANLVLEVMIKSYKKYNQLLSVLLILQNEKSQQILQNLHKAMCSTDCKDIQASISRVQNIMNTKEFKNELSKLSHQYKVNAKLVETAIIFSIVCVPIFVTLGIFVNPLFLIALIIPIITASYSAVGKEIESYSCIKKAINNFYDCEPVLKLSAEKSNNPSSNQSRMSKDRNTTTILRHSFFNWIAVDEQKTIKAQVDEQYSLELSFSTLS